MELKCFNYSVRKWLRSDLFVFLPFFSEKRLDNSRKREARKIVDLMFINLIFIILLSLIQIRNLEKLLRVCLEMHSILPENSYPLEWICKVYLEWAAGTLGQYFLHGFIFLNPAFIVALTLRYAWNRFLLLFLPNFYFLFACLSTSIPFTQTEYLTHQLMGKKIKSPIFDWQTFSYLQNDEWPP